MTRGEKLFQRWKNAKTFEEGLEALKEGAELPYVAPGYDEVDYVKAIYVMVEPEEDLEKAQSRIIDAAEIIMDRDYVPGGIMHERCKITTPNGLIFVSFECRGDIKFFSNHVLNCASALERPHAKFIDKVFLVSTGEKYELKDLEVVEF